MDQVILDNLNRSIGDTIASFQDLQNIIASAKTGPAKNVGGDNKAAENSISQLEKVMQSFVKDFKETAAEQKKYMEDVVNSMKSVSSGRSENKAAAASSAAASGGGDDTEDESKQKKEALSEERRIRLEKLQKRMKNVSKEEIPIMEKVLASLRERGKISISQYENAENLNEEQIKLVQHSMKIMRMYGNTNLEEAEALELIYKKQKH